MEFEDDGNRLQYSTRDFHMGMEDLEGNANIVTYLTQHLEVPRDIVILWTPPFADVEI